MLEELDEKAVEAAVDVPVDGAEVVAGGVVAVVGEFEAGAGLAGAALGAVRAAEKFFREEVELFELGEKGGVEKRGGGLHGRWEDAWERTNRQSLEGGGVRNKEPVIPSGV